MSVIVGQAYEHLLTKKISQNGDRGGCSFLQDLSDTKAIVGNRENYDNNAYVYPIEKRTIAKLSLEMCTECLGTENGSESGDEVSLLALEATNISKIPLTSTKPDKETKFMARENSFPPPLNSVKDSRMVRSYKEDGRLVVQAIRVCSQPRCFVSERSQGRLRLCLPENSNDGDEEFEAQQEDEGDDAEEEEVEDGILGNGEGRNGSENFRRPRRRCNENGCDEHKAMLGWKQQQQFWVTT